MTAIAILFVSHWLLAVFCQTFFLHRYAAHRMFTMSKGWERFFYLATYVTQGSSYLVPRAYAILHRQHHAFSDTPRDPHSPIHSGNPFHMMWMTKNTYSAIVHRTEEIEPRFLGGYPEWPAVDRIADSWPSRIAFGTLYTLFYLEFAPHPAFMLLLPIHFLMGPTHGLVVNWCGHKYGYRNFETRDFSRNTLPFDFVTLGELFQNNHHRHGQAPKFARRWFEVDPTWWAIRLFSILGILKLKREEPEEGAVPAAA